ncbi:MAG TPA: glycoside hydrolase family 2 TIM barrel-domain containing protein [Kineosporiaceae bacterium]|nr:glycoside hydrolase family 2 TIM barrel-domain containing protein [Kineosporiaceae bacterium]
MDDAPVHPRPQLTRTRWTDLSGTWDFTYDDADVGLRERWFEPGSAAFDRTIVVPFPPESEASGVDDSGFHRVLWYRTTFDQTPDADGALLLHFGAVDYAACVWVNGRLVATHEGGHTPFSVDVSDVLVDGGPQVLVVRAQDDPHDLEQPRGKQDWQEQPHAIWYERTSGIWQPAWLEPVPPTRIEQLRWTPDLDAAVLRLDVRLTRADDRPLKLRVVLTQHGELLADDTVTVRGDRVQRDVPFAETDTMLGRYSVLWTPDAPNLVEATIELLDAEGTVDEVASYTALRSVAAAGRRVLLNGRPYFLRLVLDQGYWRESHLAAPSGEALREEVEIIKELGFNGVRLHQKVTDPRFLYWCDRLGLLVWAEMPAAYEFSPRMIERITREWLEVLHRDYSHPCVVAWVPVNESWGVPRLERSAAQRDLVRALYHLTKALDPTRLVIGNDGWEQIVSDVVTVHDYTGRGSVLRQRYGTTEAVQATLSATQPGYRTLLLDGARWEGQPVVVSEFGGVSYVMDDEESWGGYGAVRTEKDLLDRYRQLVDALIDSPAVAGFCWTQLTDTLQEKNGLLTEQRVPKVEAALIRRINRRPAAAVPADEIGSFEYGDYPPEVMDPPR